MQTDRFNLIKVITRAANLSSRRILGNNVWTGTLLPRVSPASAKRASVRTYRAKKAIEISRTILRYRRGVPGAIVKTTDTALGSFV
jgi:hypothetical protein